MGGKGYIAQIDESLFSKANKSSIEADYGLVIIDQMIMQIPILIQVLILILKTILTKKTKTEITEIALKDLGC